MSQFECPSSDNVNIRCFYKSDSAFVSCRLPFVMPRFLMCLLIFLNFLLIYLEKFLEPKPKSGVFQKDSVLVSVGHWRTLSANVHPQFGVLKFRLHPWGRTSLGFRFLGGGLREGVPHCPQCQDLRQAIFLVDCWEQGGIFNSSLP